MLHIVRKNENTVSQIHTVIFRMTIFQILANFEGYQSTPIAIVICESQKQKEIFQI